MTCDEPYLLRGVEVARPNQVLSTDLTYIRLTRGFAYLMAIIDWCLRRVLAWASATAWTRGSAWTAWMTLCATTAG
jgi:putative transposase